MQFLWQYVFSFSLYPSCFVFELKKGNETVKEDLKKVANMTRNLSQLVELQELDAVGFLLCHMLTYNNKGVWDIPLSVDKTCWWIYLNFLCLPERNEHQCEIHEGDKSEVPGTWSDICLRRVHAAMIFPQIFPSCWCWFLRFAKLHTIFTWHFMNLWS